MKRILNSQEIRSIKMSPVAQTQCELGGDWYTNKLEITIKPKEFYPDYTEVQEAIMEKIDGKKLNIEDVVQIVYDLMTFYSPLSIHVKDTVEDCKTHMNVTVEK